MGQRVVGFVDLDCFYCAVERSRDPSLQGPLAVCQYETWRKDVPDMPASRDRRVTSGGAGLIAVSYEARARGVKRSMLASEARKVCPELVTVMVPTEHGKASLALYKEAGEDVVSVLSEFASKVEKRSVDEVAIDVTDEAKLVDDYRLGLEASHMADSERSLEATKVSGAATRQGHSQQRQVETGGIEEDDWDDYDRLLLRGAVVVARARKAVETRLGFTCSAGIAPNKLVAKISCGLHKPNQQTVALPRAVASLLKDLPLDRVPGLGGDLGRRVKDKMHVETAGEVAALAMSTFVGAGFAHDEAHWLRAMCAGTFFEPVKDRSQYQSFGSSKTFFRRPLESVADCDIWIASFAAELGHRVEADRKANARAPTTVVVSIGTDDKKSATRQEKIQIGARPPAKLIEAAGKRLVRKWATAPFRAITLGLGVSNFQELPKATPSIAGFFAAAPTDAQDSPQDAAPPAQENGNGQSDRPVEDESRRSDQPARAEPLDELEPSPKRTRADGIDDDVFNSLPPDIQDELRNDAKRKILLGLARQDEWTAPLPASSRLHPGSNPAFKRKTKRKPTSPNRSMPISAFFEPRSEPPRSPSSR